jgi:hypothetical protein
MSKFSYLYWHWTQADESLFDLTAFELAMFQDFVRLASK